MALHVLQLGPYPPPEGGISRNMLAIRDRLLAAGHRSSIIATSESTRVTDEPGVYHPRSAFGLLKLLATLRYDILHLHIGGDVGPRVLLLALAAAVFGRGKSVLTLHSGAYPLTAEARAASTMSIRGFLFRRFSRIVAVNDLIADVFCRYGVAADRLSTVLPFSLSRPDPGVTVPADLTGFCDVHSPLLLAVGGLEKDYEPLFQISAMKDVLARFPDAGLMIVGDGSLRGQVEAAVAASGYTGNICLAGDVEHKVTLHLIDKADIMLRTTLFDGDAISVREALFLGTPVIATDNGMRPAGVHLIKNNNVEALVDSINAFGELDKASGAATKESDGPAESVNENIDQILALYTSISDLGKGKIKTPV